MMVGQVHFPSRHCYNIFFSKNFLFTLIQSGYFWPFSGLAGLYVPALTVIQRAALVTHSACRQLKTAGTTMLAPIHNHGSR